jgi:hypothetical protein
MTAVLWLFMAVYGGWRLSRVWLGDPRQLVLRLGSPATATAFFQSPWPLLLLRLCIAVWVGLLPATWLTYLLAALLAPILPTAWHPLLAANLILLCSGSVWIGIDLYRHRRQSELAWPGLVRDLQRKPGRYTVAVTCFWLVFAFWLMNGTFYRVGDFIHAGYSVFSDFAPHTAIVSSFAQGRNWPTFYPHFPNDGIAYHFMFFFLCGNLNYLGLPLDWAINLPSMLGLLTCCLLLGLLALRLTGRRGTLLLAPLLMLCRSSLAFFTHLAGLIRLDPSGSLGSILQRLWQQSAFIGNTRHDDWGLWGINVYANQRHLLSGLSLLLIVLIILLPDLQAGMAQKGHWRSFWRRDTWLVRDPEARRRLLAALLIGVLMPYWHGSALVALILILLPLALFATNRLSFLAFAGASTLAALAQSRFFTGDATRVIEPTFFFGFLADERSLVGVLLYLLEVTGLALPLFVVAFWLPGWRRKILLAGFGLPLLFALTVSLTPDVTVNHKLIMITLALSNIYLADLLLRLWSGPPAQDKNGPARPGGWSGRWFQRGVAIILTAVLMVTGLQEWIIERNINRNTVTIDLQSPLVTWVRQNTAPDSIFVTAPYHYHSFFLSGRFVWYGHAYYAWSAGHDTGKRHQMVAWLLAGNDDLAAVSDLIASESLDYLLLDDALRETADFWVDEAFFTRHFVQVASFPQLGNLIIYDLHQILD